MFILEELNPQEILWYYLCMSDKVFNYKNSLEVVAIRLSKVLNEAFRKLHKECHFNLSHEEFTILEVIKSEPGIIPIEIARKISMQRSYVCKLISKLEKDGYVKQEKGIRGKKQVIIKNYISEKGEKEYKNILEIITQRYLTVTNKNERQDIEELVDKLNQICERIISDTNIKF